MAFVISPLRNKTSVVIKVHQMCQSINSYSILRNLCSTIAIGSRHECFASPGKISSPSCSSLCHQAPLRASIPTRGSQRRSGHQQPSGNRAMLWCLLGFSLKELLGEEEVVEEVEQDAELILMIKRGILAFHQGEHDLSESLLHLALKAAQEVQHELAITYIYDVLANLAYQRGHYDTAEKLFKSVLQRHVSADGDVYGNAFVAVSLKLAHCYTEKEEWENAIMGYHYCIAAQTEKVRRDDEVDQDTLVLWAMSVEQYSRLLLRLGRYAPARQHMQQALAVCRQIHGDGHLQTAVLRNDIGSIYCMEKRFSEAITEIEEAIAIVKKHLQSEEAANIEEQEELEVPQKVAPIPNMHRTDVWSNLATYHINLGSAQLLSGDRAGALASCREGERLATRTCDRQVAEEADNCVRAIKEAMAVTN